jgi:hypothetical protein
LEVGRLAAIAGEEAQGEGFVVDGDAGHS